MKLNGKQYDKFILNGKTYGKFYLNNKIYQSLGPGLILDLPLQNNFTDYSASGISMVAGGASNQPTFALSGRKAGEYCAVFTGSKSIKTTTNLPIGTDKIGISFWMKPTVASGTQMIFELSDNIGATNAFYIDFGESASKIVTRDGNAGLNNIKSNNTALTTSTWNHVFVNIDRSQNATNTITIYLNNVLQSLTTMYSLNQDTTGIFGDYIFYIGQRGGSSLGFKGSLTKLKIYNYPFTAGEVSTLYNSEL